MRSWEDTGKPHVVIIGAGFGGLYVAKSLVAQVATAGLSVVDIAYLKRRVLRKQRNARGILQEAKSIDTKYQTISESQAG